jgi:hypothetical protein
MVILARRRPHISEQDRPDLICVGLDRCWSCWSTAPTSATRMARLLPLSATTRAAAGHGRDRAPAGGPGCSGRGRGDRRTVPVNAERAPVGKTRDGGWQIGVSAPSINRSRTSGTSSPRRRGPACGWANGGRGPTWPLPGCGSAIRHTQPCPPLGMILDFCQLVPLVIKCHFA